MNLTVTVNTLNEEENIRGCLESVSWAGEIVVVDSGSSDRTVEICREYTDRVYINPWPGYSRQHAFAFSKATKDWIMVLSADARVSPELAEEIRERLEEPGDLQGFYLSYKHYFLGKWIRHCGWFPDHKLRLFRKDCVRIVDREVHEEFLLDDPSRSALLERGYVHHYTYRSLEQYLDKFNRYTSLEAQELKKSNSSFSREELLTLPLETFIEMYFKKLGYLDGLHGLVLSILSSLYVFVSRAKYWALLYGYHQAPEVRE